MSLVQFFPLSNLRARLLPVLIAFVAFSAFGLMVQAQSGSTLPRVGIEGFAHNPPSSGNIVFEVYDETNQLMARTEFAGNIGTGPTNQSGGYPAPKMFLNLIPERKYSLKVTRSATYPHTSEADRTFEAYFDTPEGCTLLVDDRPAKQIKQMVNGYGETYISLSILGKNFGEYRESEHKPVRIQEDFFMEIHLGEWLDDPNMPLGWLRLKRSVFAAGVFDRSMVSLYGAALDSGGKPYATWGGRVTGEFREVKIVDLPVSEGVGFKIQHTTFYLSQNFRAVNWEYIVKRGASDSELIIKGPQDEVLIQRDVLSGNIEKWTAIEKDGSGREWKKTVYERHLQPSGWDFKEVETHMSHHTRDADGFPTGNFVIDAQQTRYYTKFSYDSSIPDQWLGGQRDQLLLRRVEVPADDSASPVQLATTFDYYTSDAGKLGSYGKLRNRRGHDGKWHYLVYFDDANAEGRASRGSVKTKYMVSGNYSPTSFSSTPPDASSSLVENYGFQSWAGSFYYGLISLTETRRNGTLIGKETVTTTLSDASGSPAGTQDIMTRVIRRYSAANEYLETVEKLYSPYAERGLVSQPIETITPDGTKSVYSYETGLLSGPVANITDLDSFTPATIPNPMWRVVKKNLKKDGGNYVYVPGVSTATGQICGVDFKVLYEGEYAITNTSGALSPALSSRVAEEYSAPSFNAISPIFAKYNDGTAESSSTFSSSLHGIGLQKTDRNGIKSAYLFDPLKRNFRVTSEGLSPGFSIAELGALNESSRQTDMIHDSLDRVISISTKAVGGSESINQSTVYNYDGSVRSQTAACCATTSYHYYYESGWTSAVSGASSSASYAVLTTESTGAQELRTFLADGTVFQVWRTDPSFASTAWTKISETASGLSGSQLYSTVTSGSGQWQKTTIDWLGRSTLVERSAPPQSGSPATASTTYTYETGTGRLTKVTSSERAAVFYQEDPLSGVFRTVVDSNGNNVVDLSSDRVSETTTVYENVSSQWWLKNSSAVYVSGQTPKVVQQSRARLTGFGTVGGETDLADIQVTDVRGRTTYSTTKLKASEKKLTSMVIDGLTNQAVSTITVNGLLRGQSLPAPGSGWTTYTYDELGRQMSVSHPLTGQTYRGYVSGSTKVSHDIVGGRQMTKYYYNAASAAQGSRQQLQSLETYLYSGTNAADPASYGTLQSTQTFTYNPAGALTGQGGNGGHAVTFAYDALGRKKEQQSINAVGSVKTEWDYQPSSGLLAAKRFRENSTTAQTWTYSYDLAGAIKSVIDPRNVTTGFDYNLMGEIEGLEYDSSYSGDEVGYNYDRLGRVHIVTDATLGQRTFTYRDTDDLQLSQVSFDSGYYGTAVTGQHLEYHETTGDKRLKAVVLKSGTTEVYRSQYGYLANGQLDTVASTEPNANFSRTFQFGYAGGNNPYAPTSLSAAVSAGNYYRQDYHYDALGRMDAIVSGRVTSSSQSLFGGNGQLSGSGAAYGHYYYLHNALGQIKQEERRGQLFAGFTSGNYGGIATSYGYDTKGQIESAVSQRLAPGTYGSGYEGSALPGLSVGYEYDASGNLMHRRVDLDTTAGVSSGNYAETSFVSNILNQLSNRTSSGVLPVGGTASPAAMLAVGTSLQSSAGTAVRVGPYFHRGIPHDNSQAMLGVAATIVAQQAGSPAMTSVEARQSVVPKASMAFTYDASGNQLTDGEFTYTWDNQNRLMGITRTNQAAGWLGVSMEQRYRYSSDGWRVEKQYVQGELAGKRTRYVYFGADVIAEVDVALNGSGAVTNAVTTKTYHWRPSGVGRAGRLLEMVDRVRGRAALAGYDGRGNLTMWTDANDGALLGGRDYGPYGEVWLENWQDAQAKAAFGETGFGFSTEYKDETGLVYFGFRYYRPELGRFISRDPAGEAGSGVNLYAFAGGDPVNNRELYGLCPFGLDVVWGFLRNTFARVSEVFGDAFGLNKSNYEDLGETVMLDRFVTTENRLGTIAPKPVAFLVTIAVHVPNIDVQDWIYRMKDVVKVIDSNSQQRKLRQTCLDILSKINSLIKNIENQKNNYRHFMAYTKRLERNFMRDHAVNLLDGSFDMVKDFGGDIVFGAAAASGGPLGPVWGAFGNDMTDGIQASTEDRPLSAIGHIALGALGVGYEISPNKGKTRNFGGRAGGGFLWGKIAIKSFAHFGAPIHSYMLNDSLIKRLEAQGRDQLGEIHKTKAEGDLYNSEYNKNNCSEVLSKP
jgi:RHS repeat-associated protein